MQSAMVYMLQISVTQLFELYLYLTIKCTENSSCSVYTYC